MVRAIQAQMMWVMQIPPATLNTYRKKGTGLRHNQYDFTLPWATSLTGINLNHIDKFQRVALLAMSSQLKEKAMTTNG